MVDAIHGRGKEEEGERSSSLLLWEVPSILLRGFGTFWKETGEWGFHVMPATRERVISKVA